jgi:hypothetical protein
LEAVEEPDKRTEEQAKKTKEQLQKEHAGRVKITEERLTESKGLEQERNQRVKETETAKATSKKATQLRDSRYSASRKTSARVLAFDAYVRTQMIPAHTKYAMSEWPDKPEEFYAEAFADWIMDPDSLRKSSPKLHAYFSAGSHRKD